MFIAACLLTQLVDQRTDVHDVIGSNPTGTNPVTSLVSEVLRMDAWLSPLQLRGFKIIQLWIIGNGQDYYQDVCIIC